MSEIDMTPLYTLRNEFRQALIQIRQAFHADEWNDAVCESYGAFLEQLDNLAERLDEAADESVRIAESLSRMNLEEKLQDADRLCDEAENI